MILDIDSIALEAARDVARISRSRPVGGHSQMVAQMQCRIIDAINAAKRSMQGKAKPVARVTVRTDGYQDWTDINTSALPAGVHELFAAPPSTDAKEAQP